MFRESFAGRDRRAGSEGRRIPRSQGEKYGLFLGARRDPGRMRRGARERMACSKVCLDRGRESRAGSGALRLSPRCDQALSQASISTEAETRNATPSDWALERLCVLQLGRLMPNLRHRYLLTHP
jgi:hypothetical protein